MKNISILGATGSIGTQALDILRSERKDFRLIGVTANTNYNSLFSVISEFHPKYAALMNDEACMKLKKICNDNNIDIEILSGIDGLNTIAALEENDIILNSVVGMIGLVPTLSAIKAGNDVALANKETLVTGGQLVYEELEKSKAHLLPVDSEHGAIFQCLQGNKHSALNKIILTASGGPFRGKSRNELLNVTVDDALKHPNWSMGRKVTIDSATLMNKGLEVIEAHWLFHVDYDHIQAIIHPQSIIHSMVEYIDGSIIAQLGSPDMRLPIQYALNYPERKNAVVKKLDLLKAASITFEEPDLDTFIPLKLAYEAGKAGGLMPTVLNAANEIAVQLFIDRRISFLKIGEIIYEALNKFNASEHLSVESIHNTETEVRKYIESCYCD